MQPTDHVQMVTSWCELMLRCVDRVGISEMPGKTVQHSRYFYTAITSTSDHERGDDSWWLIDCTAIDIYISISTLGSATIFGFLRLPSASQTVADCCKVWHFSRYILLAIWIHSALSLMSVAPRLYECSNTYSVQGEYEVASSPASEHSLLLHTHDLWSCYNSPCSRAVTSVTCCLPPDFFLLSLYYKGCSL